MAITDTHGSLDVLINQQLALTPDSVKTIYTGNTLLISAINSEHNSILSVFRLEMARNIQSGTYELGTHSDFQGAYALLSDFPIIIETKRATVTLEEANHVSQTYVGSFIISGMSVFGKLKHYDIYGSFSLQGAYRMF